MKRALHLLLLLGALIGLLGVQSAYASGPRMPTAPVAVSGMDADCMEMMEKERPRPVQGPCKGMTLDCIAAMGCIVPVLAISGDSADAVRRVAATPLYWTVAPVLTGTDLSPEQHPPTLRG
ncbi:MAG: hypothetical protein MT490_08720 [Sphingomonas sp.]|uniref:hypothetical protein n=1 Tax=Sphingomonas sp. TaxID=28214 RepID=UPI0022750D1C|nr:hypothetical protein [Sphingomonas sp.]MCX8475863.1 hypothetical protein [Sphingomonas sp.]